MAHTGFELLVPAIERHLPILQVAAPYMRRFLRPRRIVYLASRRCLEALGRNGILSPIDVAMDEDEVAEGLSLGLVREILRLRGSDPARGGWYFKQIAILAYAQRFEAEERYLTWDADTVPLRETDFVDAEGRTILERKTEYNAAYFRTIKSLLGIERQVEYSYIAEHMMFDS